MAFFYNASYKFHVVMELVGLFSQLILFYFISKLVSPEKIPGLAAYQNDYFAFVLVGIAFSGYFAVVMGGPAGGLREDMSLGTLESFVLSPEPLLFITIWYTAWGLFKATVNTFIYLLAGLLMFNLTLPSFPVFSALFLLFISLLAFLPLGILGAAFVLVFKQGNPINLLYTLFKFIGGVYFPITLFPDWLQKLAWFQPFTPALEGLRKVVLGGASLSQVTFEIKLLTGFTLVLFPVSVWCFQLAYRRARLAGSLSHY